MKSEKLKKKTSKDFYVNPDEMWEEFNLFYEESETSKNPDSVLMSSELGKMIDDIATKLGFMGKFINYSFKDEMIGDARVKMVKAVYDKNFSLWKSYYCTPILTEGDREYVIIYNERKQEWDDKKTYLKDWDTIEELKTPPLVEISSLNPIKIKLAYNDDLGVSRDVMHKITVKNNPFSYFTKIAYHAFVNRIKKEKKSAEVLALYQEKVFEDMYSSGNGWENVKRQVIDDEDSYYYDNDPEDFFYEDSSDEESDGSYSDDDATF